MIHPLSALSVTLEFPYIKAQADICDVEVMFPQDSTSRRSDPQYVGAALLLSWNPAFEYSILW